MRVAQLTPHQYKVICNGVGPKGLGFKCWQLKFKSIADQHDLDYWIGGSEEDRKLYDLEFSLGCLRIAGRCSGLQRVHLTFAAILYYRLTRIFGRFCFHYGEKRTEEDLEKLE